MTAIRSQRRGSNGWGCGALLVVALALGSGCGEGPEAREGAALPGAAVQGLSGPCTAQALIDQGMKYFVSSGAFDCTCGLPFEGLGKTYTQLVAIGMAANLLAEVATGQIVTQHMTAERAADKLRDLASCLLTLQADPSLAWNGLLPWLSYQSGRWVRDPGTYGQQVSVGDNALLAVLLAQAAGALVRNPVPLRTHILVNLDRFIWNQRPGYQALVRTHDAAGNPVPWLLRRGVRFDGSYLGGDEATIDLFGSEYRAGVMLVTLRMFVNHGVYGNLVAHFRPFTRQNGFTYAGLAPYQGAFQLLWPVLAGAEAAFPAMRRTLGQFVDFNLEHAAANSRFGFPSASYGSSGYVPTAGIPQLAIEPGGVTDQVTSLYTLGPAYMLRPTTTLQHLCAAVESRPDILGPTGPYEGFDYRGGSEAVVKEQVAANVAGLVLGLAGQNTENYRAFLGYKGLLSRFNALMAQSPWTGDLAAGATVYSDPSTKVVVQGNGTLSVRPARGSTDAWLTLVGPARDLSGRVLSFRYTADHPSGKTVLELKKDAVTYRTCIDTKVAGPGTNLTQCIHNTASEGIPMRAWNVLNIYLPVHTGLRTIREVGVVLSGMDPSVTPKVDITDVKVF